MNLLVKVNSTFWLKAKLWALVFTFKEIELVSRQAEWRWFKMKRPSYFPVLLKRSSSLPDTQLRSTQRALNLFLRALDSQLFLTDVDSLITPFADWSYLGSIGVSWATCLWHFGWLQHFHVLQLQGKCLFCVFPFQPLCKVHLCFVSYVTRYSLWPQEEHGQFNLLLRIRLQAIFFNFPKPTKYSVGAVIWLASPGIHDWLMS